MNNQAYILVGMMFGDEGKGTFVDYLTFAENIKQIIRYNGGSQASHTVVNTDSQVHKFSQLGSGMFLDDCRTYLSSNMVVNPTNLIEEVRQFSPKVKATPEAILERVFIDEKCYIVTPYHKLINKLRELSNAHIRRGSVGTGVSEVMKLLNDENLGIPMRYLRSLDFQKELQEKLDALFSFTCDFFEKNKPFIDPVLLSNQIDEGELYYLTNAYFKKKILKDYLDLILHAKLNIISGFRDFYRANEKSLFEGAQGILLDFQHGLKPNTTCLDTTNKFSWQLLEQVKGDPAVSKIGISKAFASRHGMGVFPTEDKELGKRITDENQESSYWNGNIRFGWFDAILMRYAQAVSGVDELYLSSIDKMTSFPKIKICRAYKYNGVVDDNFREMFDYEIKGDQIIIKDIKNNNGDISSFLYQCEPIYIEVDGWNENIEEVKDADDLPKECLHYLQTIEDLVGVKISLASVGPTRKDKVKIR